MSTKLTESKIDLIVTGLCPLLIEQKGTTGFSDKAVLGFINEDYHFTSLQINGLELSNYQLGKTSLKVYDSSHNEKKLISTEPFPGQTSDQSFSHIIDLCQNDFHGGNPSLNRAALKSWLCFGHGTIYSYKLVSEKVKFKNRNGNRKVALRNVADTIGIRITLQSGEYALLELDRGVTLYLKGRNYLINLDNSCPDDSSVCRDTEDDFEAIYKFLNQINHDNQFVIDRDPPKGKVGKLNWPRICIPVALSNLTSSSLNNYFL